MEEEEGDAEFEENGSEEKAVGEAESERRGGGEEGK